MSSRTAPSHGQKVDLGQNAPVAREGTGAVASDSLAAESRAFKSENNATPRDYSREELSTSSQAHEGARRNDEFASHSGTGAQHTVDEAPSYVSNQYVRDTSGPHGKNITEDPDLSRDNRNNASFTEFGTKNDPARLAEQKFAAADSTPAAGTAQRQTGISGNGAFDALGSEEA
jgi:hypothetical protein